MHDIQTSRFHAPYPIAIRGIKGPLDLAVVIIQDRDGLSLSLWHGHNQQLTPVDYTNVSFATTITPDGKYILDLDDPTGSELGHLHAFPIAGGSSIDLTPQQGAYTIRGIDTSLDGQSVLITGADDNGFFVILTPIHDPSQARTVFTSANESWSGILSADNTLVAVETTDHNPGIRRFATSVVDVATSTVIAVLSDGPLAPVRPVRFAQTAGDMRLLAYTEASGFARPVIWDPGNGDRIDIPLPELHGDVIPLDWHSASGMILLVHVAEGIHQLYEHDIATGITHKLAHPAGSYFEPDVGAEFPMIWASYYTHTGTKRLTHSSWDVPLHLLESVHREPPQIVMAPHPVPSATPFTSHQITSRDGTNVQLWVGVPADRDTIRGIIFDVHGGPNLVTVDRYDALAQSWLDDGWIFASLNYRGSVTNGRVFREKYWRNVGVGEIADIEAAIDWLTLRHPAQKETMFITGASYGGFLTLLALAKLPDRFRGGFAHVALCDWVAAYQQMNPAIKTAWRCFMGSDPADDITPWQYASPLTYIATVRAPVWLNQGLYDSRTPPKQALQYAEALKAQGGDVRLDWFAGGHMPGGLAGMHNDFQKMHTLANRALHGQRWDDTDAS